MNLLKKANKLPEDTKNQRWSERLSPGMKKELNELTLAWVHNDSDIRAKLPTKRSLRLFFIQETGISVGITAFCDYVREIENANRQSK